MNDFLAAILFVLGVIAVMALMVACDHLKSIRDGLSETSRALKAGNKIASDAWGKYTPTPAFLHGQEVFWLTVGGDEKLKVLSAGFVGETQFGYIVQMKDCGIYRQFIAPIGSVFRTKAEAEAALAKMS